MTTPIVFPDTETWVAAYLTGALAGTDYRRAHVSDTYRGDALEVWVQRDGGPVLDVVRELVRLRINCFHPDPSAIIPFAQMVSALMLACPDGRPVLRATRSSGPFLIAPSVKPQAYMLFELTVRGEPLT